MNEDYWEDYGEFNEEIENFRESLKEAMAKLNGSGAHACYCARSTDGGCTCALKDEYVDELEALLAAETKRVATEARIDELYRMCAINADLAEWPMITKRIDRLNAQLKAELATLNKLDNGSK